MFPMLLAAALPKPLHMGVAAPENFCFPPYSTVNVALPAFFGANGNSSIIAFEQIWTTPELFRADVFYSGTPFAGGPTPPGWIGPTEFGILRNTTSGETWQWYPLPGTGQTYCSKGTDNSPSALCIGGDLTLNATHTVGGVPSYTWVGFEDRGPEQEACWHSLLINSKEATDPARWMSATSQCVSQKGSGGLYPSSNVQTLAFSDFSTEPFAPGVFDLPAACQKL